MTLKIRIALSTTRKFTLLLKRDTFNKRHDCSYNTYQKSYDLGFGIPIKLTKTYYRKKIILYSEVKDSLSKIRKELLYSSVPTPFSVGVKNYIFIYRLCAQKHKLIFKCISLSNYEKKTRFGATNQSYSNTNFFNNDCIFC